MGMTRDEMQKQCSHSIIEVDNSGLEGIRCALHHTWCYDICDEFSNKAFCKYYYTCPHRTAGCVGEPDEGCPVYRYFKEIINKDGKQEPRKGYWIKKHDNIGWWYVCDKCGSTPLCDMNTKEEVLSPYCPNCGAKMAETEET